jgi:hypothetical protein
LEGNCFTEWSCFFRIIVDVAQWLIGFKKLAIVWRKLSQVLLDVSTFEDNLPLYSGNFMFKIWQNKVNNCNFRVNFNFKSIIAIFIFKFTTVRCEDITFRESHQRGTI